VTGAAKTDTKKQRNCGNGIDVGNWQLKSASKETVFLA
jgi:hypothetical protein